MHPEALDHCPWLCSAPEGPNTPFAWPEFALIDTLRVLMSAAAVILLVLSVWAVRKSETRGQKCRFAFAGLLCIAVFGTEIEHLGDIPNWRFVVNGTAVTLGLWGYYQHLFREVPARDRAAGQSP